MLRRLVLLVLLLASASAQTNNSLAFRRAQHLRHGINLSEWFAQSSDYSAARLSSYTTPEDIDLIKRLGFDHVRISIDPNIFSCVGSNDCETVRILDASVDHALRQDLGVVIDLHPSGEWKQQLVNDNNAVLAAADLWRRIAHHYADRDAERIFFEVLNEPEFKDPYRWTGVQQSLVQAIRARAPQHTIIVAGANWSAVPELLLTGVVPDNNVIYNFHYYEPHTFTHQGASWGEHYWNELRRVPYPATYMDIKPLLATLQSDATRWRLLEYGLSDWNRERVNAEIGFMGEWAKKNNVPIICNEFGAYRTYADPKHRAAWIRDVRTAFDQNGIGWTMWDYRGGFGVVSKDSGKTEPDPTTLEALGMKSR